jgi:Family of unknown function (DUF5684)
MFENSSLGSADVGMLAGIMAIAVGFGLVFYIFYSFCMAKVFQKAGKPMWAGFVPVYNVLVLLEIIGRPWWWILVLIGLCIVPVVGPMLAVVVSIVIWIDTARSFGKDTVFGVLLALLTFIFLPILAFSSTIQYVGPRASGLGLPSQS